VPYPNSRSDEIVPAQVPEAFIAFWFGFVHRQIWLVLTCLIITASIGALYEALSPPAYTASATMLIDSRKGGVQQKSVLGDAPSDSTWIESQIGILNLERGEVGQLVAKQLADKQLALASNLDQSNSALGGRLITAIFKLLPLGIDETPTTKEQFAGTVASHLEVKRVGLSYLVSVSFTSQNPEQATTIANAAADAYVQNDLHQKLETLRQASDWLLARYKALGEQASAADRAVVEFKTKHNIITASGKLINDEQLTEVNKRLGEARAKVADEQARLNQIEIVLNQQESSGTVDATVSDALQNPIITRLRGQYLDLINKIADWSKQFGPDHQAVVNLRNRARDIRNSTHQELGRIAESYKSDLEIAKKNEQELEKQLQAIVLNIPSDAQINLRELETSAQSYHTFYDNFLSTYTEAVQQGTSPIPDKRVVSYADWASPSKPSYSRVALIVLFAGAVLGVGLGILREALDRSIRTMKQLHTLQTNCLAVLPTVKNGPLRLVSEEPFSRFAEGLRSLKLAVDLKGSGTASKVIGMTSSVPREGKSTVAAALASFIAHVGGDVILVDCDFRKATLSRSFFPKTGGIVEVIQGELSLEKAILRDPVTKLAFLPAGNVSQLTDTGELLAGNAMRTLFHTLRAKYKYVIVDLPPVAPVIDVRATAHLIDLYLYVIEWGRTKVDVVRHAFTEGHRIHENLLGVVLNKVNFKSIGRYEGYGFDYYSNRHFASYYHDVKTVARDRTMGTMV
jgi:polysaccharide biosynthesis transport protein